MVKIEHLRELLQDRRIDIVAEKTGISYMTIVKLRNGSLTNPTYRVIEALENYFNAEINGKN